MNNLHASYDRLIHYWVDIFEARWIRDGVGEAEAYANAWDSSSES